MTVLDFRRVSNIEFQRERRAMARRTRLLLAACILTCLSLVSEAGEVFTEFQIDNKSQYFTYLGVRTPILRNSAGSGLFVQAMTTGSGCQHPV